MRIVARMGNTVACDRGCVWSNASKVIGRKATESMKMDNVVVFPVDVKRGKNPNEFDVTSEIASILATMDRGQAQSVERLNLVLLRLQTLSDDLLAAVEVAPDNNSRRDILQQGRSIQSLILTAEKLLQEVRDGGAVSSG